MRKVTILVGIVLILTSTTFAANTGSLTGRCLTSEGEALPGVTVQITSAQLIGGPQVAISGAEGEFSFNLLAPGDYSVEGTLPGFRTAAGSVRVSADATASVELFMIPEQFGEEIQVNATVPVVDTSQVNTRQVWDEDYLTHATVGSGNRSYQSVLTQAAGVGGGSNPNVFGGTVGENAYLIDGMNTTDTVVGTFSTNFNMDAVQEMNFQTGGYEAEFGQATGGIVNLVTKSGGNQFSGSLDVRYRNEDMAESGADEDSATSTNQTISGTLGGPFLRDKLWFFTSLQYVDNTYLGVYDNFPWNYEGYMFLGKVTWQVADGHRVIGKYHTDPAEIPGANQSVYVLPSAKAQQDQGGDIWQFELNSVLSSSWLLNAQVGSAGNYIRVFSADLSSNISGHQNTVNNLYYNAYRGNTDDERPRNEARVNATWFVDNLAGSHEFKGGIEYADTGFDQVYFLNGGAFIYDNNGNASPSFDPIDLNGDGYYNAYINRKEPLETVKDPVSVSGNIGTLYVQDAWRIHPNLTIKPGIRLDNSVLKNDPGDTIADMDTWQPRLGVAWDIKGNARHVLRASVGRFMDPTTLMIPSFASGVEETYHEYSTLEYYCNLSRGQWCTPEDLPAAFGDPIFWTNWDGQEYTLYDNRGTTIYDPAQTVDEAGVGSLKAPVSDEVILTYEVQVAPQMSIEFSYVNKESKDLIEDTCVNNTWAYGDGPLPSLDDEDTWTLSAGCTNWLIVNMPVYFRDYEAGIVKFEARRGWGNLIASYTYAESTGNNESGPRHYAYGDGDFFPVNFYNHEGNLGDHREHRLKINGFLTLPKRWIIGIDGYYSSPSHYTINSSCTNFSAAPGRRSTSDQIDELGIDRSTIDFCTTPDGGNLGSYDIFHSNRGAFDTKSLYRLDLQVSKGFRVGSTEITGILAILNVFGTELGTAFNSDAFRQATETDEDGFVQPLVYQDDDPSAPYYDEYYGADSSPVLVPVGEPTSFQQPRRYELGLRIEF